MTSQHGAYAIIVVFIEWRENRIFHEDLLRESETKSRLYEASPNEIWDSPSFDEQYFISKRVGKRQNIALHKEKNKTI